MGNKSIAINKTTHPVNIPAIFAHRLPRYFSVFAVTSEPVHTGRKTNTSTTKPVSKNPANIERSITLLSWQREFGVTSAYGVTHHHLIPQNNAEE